MKNLDYYVNEKGNVAIARVITFGCANRKDIVRRLMNTSAFKFLTFADALNAYRYAENNGLIERNGDMLTVYHDAN